MVELFAEGNYTDGHCFTFTAIPGISDAAAAKLGKRASGLGKTFKALDKAGDALSGVKSAASAIGKAVKTSGPAKQMMAAADTARAFVDKVPDGLKQVVARYGNEIEAGAEFSVGTVMELNAAYEQYGDDLTAEQIQQIVLGNARSTTVGYGIGKGINKAADKWLPRGGVDAPNGRTGDVDAGASTTRTSETNGSDANPTQSDLTTNPRGGSDADTMPSTSSKQRINQTESINQGSDSLSSERPLLSNSTTTSNNDIANQHPELESGLGKDPKAENIIERELSIADTLSDTAPKRLSQLSSNELDTELSLRDNLATKPINDGDYIAETELPKGHEWKERKDGALCRFSDNGECLVRGNSQGTSAVEKALEELKDRHPDGSTAIAPVDSKNVLADDPLPERMVEDNGSLVPLGFNSADDYRTFTSELSSELENAGFDDVTSVFQGSSVTGFKGFDKSNRDGSLKKSAGTIFEESSDFDIALSSPKLLAQIKSIVGKRGMRSGGKRTSELNTRTLRQLGLLNLRNSLQQQTGRDVNFMVFDAVETIIGKKDSFSIITD